MEQLTPALKELVKSKQPRDLEQLKYLAKKEATQNIIKEIKKYGFTVSDAKHLLDWAKEQIESETVIKD